MRTDPDQIRHAWRFPPCPAYDVEGTESWLSDMAAQGLVLGKDGFFAGFAIFERREPAAMRYRLSAASKSAGLFSPDDGAPDEQEVALNQAYGWAYVATRGDFHIYAASGDAVELHTDPVVQAMALKCVEKRMRGGLIWLILWLAIYPLCCVWGGFLQGMIETGTWFYLLGALLVLSALGTEIAQLRYMHGLRRRLRDGQQPNHQKDWRAARGRFQAEGIGFVLLALVWFGARIHLWNDAVMEVGRVDLAQYDQPIPFATMADFASGSVYTAEKGMTYSNKIWVKSDILAPVAIEFDQAGSLRLPDGQTVSGGLDVRYYQTASPWLAKVLAQELARRDWHSNQKRYQPLDLPQLTAQQAYGYAALFPTVVLQKGDRVLRATFYQTGAQIPYAQWVQALDAGL